MVIIASGIARGRVPTTKMAAIGGHTDRERLPFEWNLPWNVLDKWIGLSHTNCSLLRCRFLGCQATKNGCEGDYTN